MPGCTIKAHSGGHKILSGAIWLYKYYMTRKWMSPDQRNIRSVVNVWGDIWRLTCFIFTGNGLIDLMCCVGVWRLLVSETSFCFPSCGAKDTWGNRHSFLVSLPLCWMKKFTRDKYSKSMFFISLSVFFEMLPLSPVFHDIYWASKKTVL